LSRKHPFKHLLELRFTILPTKVKIACMAPVPKKKHSKGRTKRRRYAVTKKSKMPNFSLCPSCKKPKLPHVACPSCGHYK